MQNAEDTQVRNMSLQHYFKVDVCILATENAKAKAPEARANRSRQLDDFQRRRISAARYC